MEGCVKGHSNLPIQRLPVLFSREEVCLADAPILSSQSIRDFFRDLLARAIENQRARVQPFTELYLVNLLHEFLASQALYVQADDGTWQQNPLAFLLKEALEEAGPARLRLLRRLGDTSLFISGFFPDSLARRSSLVDVDYYIAMGGRAYDGGARHARGPAPPRRSPPTPTPPGASGPTTRSPAMPRSAASGKSWRTSSACWSICST